MSLRSNAEVVVSGIGLVTPLGGDLEATWSAVLASKSAIREAEHGLEAAVVNYSPNGARSRAGDFAITAAREALRHADMPARQPAGESWGCVIGQSKPLVSGHSLAAAPWPDASLVLSSYTGWSLESVVRRSCAMTGPALNVAAACATGVLAIHIAADWIREGRCAVAVAGTAESSLNEFYRSGFRRMGVLAEGLPGDVRPFDRDRSGFAIGEGAGMFVLESKEHALRRGHRPIARVVSTAMRQNAVDLITGDVSGSAVARLIGSVLKGGCGPDYINAHGTGTRANDAAEVKGLREVFGPRALRIPVSSTKAATGHLLGSAGAVEAAFAVLSIRDQQVPPTLHLKTPDPDFDLDFVPEKARGHRVRSAMSLSYGFGGQLGAVVFGESE